MKHHHHELNKNKMKNDIALTIALIVSMLFSKYIMHLTGLNNHVYDTFIFFVIGFVSTKITYNLFNKIIDKFIENKK